MFTLFTDLSKPINTDDSANNPVTHHYVFFPHTVLFTYLKQRDHFYAMKHTYADTTNQTLTVFEVSSISSTASELKVHI